MAGLVRCPHTRHDIIPDLPAGAPETVVFLSNLRLSSKERAGLPNHYSAGVGSCGQAVGDESKGQRNYRDQVQPP
jgi:hypothetical protein